MAARRFHRSVSGSGVESPPYSGEFEIEHFLNVVRLIFFVAIFFAYRSTPPSSATTRHIQFQFSLNNINSFRSNVFPCFFDAFCGVNDEMIYTTRKSYVFLDPAPIHEFV